MENIAMHNALEEARTKYDKGRYDMDFMEMLELRARAKNGELCDAITDSFNYGFIKGIRYAKAMQKKAKKSLGGGKA